MEAILETGLACLAPPFVVLVLSATIVSLMILIDRKVIKD